ncbi:hypothetical protein JOQ06_007473 [Pogonophryne albipinna]|uniref:Uncharacterized protein n=1 Tax=Pogonophryne albipinna TaxID=1090488 RepID=A0AAD6FI90_9TELE|nr:hypothetical protein JOQ06_007473 [Pogonophryne albipinna]
MIDTFDRPGGASAEGAYAGTNTYAVGLEVKPGKRIPKAGATASAGVGYARAEWSVFDAEAKGPNASVGAVASAGTLSASAFARAELGSASASAEAKVLGTGFSFGSKTGVYLLGNGFEFNCW